MPELPEVETIKRSLEKRLSKHTITSVDIFLPKIIHPLSILEFKEIITRKKIINLSRRGKYLLVHLSAGLTIIIHLRMTGQLIFYKKHVLPAKHTHLILKMNDGQELHFNDQRKFGKILLASTKKLNEVPGLKDLGIEPLDKDFSLNHFQQKLKKRRAKIKNLLLNQTFIAGLGNIYADETLHKARINPQRTAASLDSEEIAVLYNAIQAVLREGIENRGTTLKNYVDGDGQGGNYQKFLHVYNRENKPCFHCKTNITRIKLSGRSSYFCPHCQK